MMPCVQRTGGQKGPNEYRRRASLTPFGGFFFVPLSHSGEVMPNAQKIA
jgi:hypothetical protein